MTCEDAPVAVVERRSRPGGPGPIAVIVGPMGAGKTTVGRELATQLGADFVDVDHFIESMNQLSIAEIFEAHGEEHFRKIEAAAVEHVLATSRGVVSVGGGALTTLSTRELLRSHPVVRLYVGADQAMLRIGDGQDRPLLSEGDDPRTRWLQVAAERESAFADVTVWEVDTNTAEPAVIASAITDALAADKTSASARQKNAHERFPGVVDVIAVGKGTNAYDVVVGHQLIDVVVAAVPAEAERVLIVHQAAVRERAEVLQGRCKAKGFETYLAEVPDGEEAKTAQVLAFLWQVLGQAGLTRTDAVVGLGGGAATDLAGYAAASWLRGVRVVQVPTTVAGMVDAAVGGKTGINTAEGKNLVGAFHPPHAVCADLDALSSLPECDVAAGLAEVVKAGFIADPRILEIIEAHPDRVLDVESSEFAEVLTRAIRVKADVVSEDLTEQGRREILNYGHTLAHAVERCERYQWRHGAAVSVGMVFAAELAFLAGYIDEKLVERHRAILTSLGLPITYRGGQWDSLMEAMRRDKKARGSLLRFVVLTGTGTTTRLEGPDPALLTAAYAAVSE